MKKSIGAKLAFSPLPTLVIGTYNADMKPNVMTASFGGIVSAVPPTLGVSIRKATLTYENIVRSKVFTISIPSEKYVKEMDYFGLVNGKNNAKFLDTGLTAMKGTFVDAPYVEEFPVNIECKLINTIELGSHIQIIGEIVEVKLNEEIVDEKGNSDITKMKPISYVGNDRSYYGLGANLGKAFSIGSDFKPNKEL
jgi:flavin reductase (DIM6/NTAB) family NADH-FMN oxidoreductase RutF